MEDHAGSRIHASGGSDAPVVSFDAMENIYFAVTRKNINGEPKEAGSVGTPDSR